MNELDEMLQHHGVKGMKWGVIRKGLKEKKQAKLNNYHEKNKNNKAYDAYYKSARKYKNTHEHSVAYARSRLRDRNGAIVGTAIMAGGVLSKKALSMGYKAATNPNTIRAGKNIVQAIKRSPIRHVDGSKMTNVITRELMKR